MVIFMEDTEMYDPQMPEPEIEQGYIYIENVGLQPVTYAVCGDLAIYEGDIVLGDIDTMGRMRRLIEGYGSLKRGETGYNEMIVGACAISTAGRWWKNAIIPYKINTATNVAAIDAAVEYINKYTPVKLLKRTSEADYVSFEQSIGCSSLVGKKGGQQEINISNAAKFGNVVHEVFHAAGLWHEHSRRDRDTYVTYYSVNVKSPSKAHNFNIRTGDGKNLTKYDYDSIMHYSAGAFANPGTQTLVPTTPGVTIGQRNHASKGDILGLAYMRVYA